MAMICYLPEHENMRAVITLHMQQRCIRLNCVTDHTKKIALKMVHLKHDQPYNTILVAMVLSNHTIKLHLIHVCMCMWYRWFCSGQLQWCWCHCLTTAYWAVSNKNVRLHALAESYQIGVYVLISSMSLHGAGMRWPSWCTGAITHHLSLMTV